MNTNNSSRNDTVPAVSYAAKSSKDEHDSVPGQQATIRDRVDSESARSLVAEYAEENRSGWKDDRGPELEAAMAHAVRLASEEHRVELWVWHSSRLGRGSGIKGEARSILEVFAYLRRRGVTLRSVKDDEFVTSSMLVGFAAEQAEKYSADLSSWVTAGKERQWERGDWLGGPIPDGLQSDGAKSVMLDADRAPIIRRIWDLALDKRACATIARQLNAEGLRTKTGGAWTRRRIQDTLSNAVYAGIIVRWRGTPHEQRKPGRHPAIVTPEEFAAVAEYTRARDITAKGRTTAGRPSRRFLLATLARCSRCGSTMYSRTSTYRRKDGTRARSYLCAHVVNGTGLCHTDPVSAGQVDQRVLDRLPRFIEAAEQWLRDLGSDHQGANAHVRAKVQAAERHVLDIRARVNNLTDRYALEQDLTSPKAEALLDALAQARTELKRAQTAAQRAQTEHAAVHHAIEGDTLATAHRALHHALQAGETTAIAELNRRMREHFDAFVIDPDGNPIPIWKVELPPTLATRVAETVNDQTVAAYIESRTAELALIEHDPEHNGEGSHG